MAWFQTLSGKWAGVLATTAAVVGLAAMVLLPSSSPFAMPVILGTGAAALWLVSVYWGRIDEAAREAQKSAWLWGGSAGLGAGFALLLPPHGAWVIPAGVSVSMLPAVGGLIVVTCGLAGFLVAWAIWWLRHR